MSSPKRFGCVRFSTVRYLSIVLGRIQGGRALVAVWSKFVTKIRSQPKGTKQKGDFMERFEAVFGIKELAQRLDIKVSTLYDWVHTRQIPHYKVGRLVKFRRPEVERWLERRRVGVAS